MTIAQVKGMLRFHKSAYKAYKQVGNEVNAQIARLLMLNMYLNLRATR